MRQQLASWLRRATSALSKYRADVCYRIGSPAFSGLDASFSDSGVRSRTA